MQTILMIGRWTIDWDGTTCLVLCNGPMQTTTTTVDAAVRYVMDRVTLADIRETLVEIGKDNFDARA
jgi:hypothetical protein